MCSFSTTPLTWACTAAVYVALLATLVLSHAWSL